ncbi:MAG: hypothetical protein PHQ59_00995 [Candidatus Daviesbacteria bacterium]|nr:hypothetical protein [Candidatus Daviesbacteria bacterium]
MKTNFNHHQLFLISIGAFSSLAAILGVINYLGGNFSAHSWAFFPLGIFVWGDAIVLGTFLAIASVTLWKKDNPIYSGLFFSIYATIRAFIEALYGLNAQFSSLNRPWEKEWLEIANNLNLSPLELYMFDQIIATCIAIISLLVFLSFFKKYIKI